MSASMPIGGSTPAASMAITTFISLITAAAQAVCLSQRLAQVLQWRGLTTTHWTILVIYSDSILFVIATAVLSHGFGLNSSQTTCTTAVLLCLVFYMTTKLIYFFLVEKAYIVAGVETPRLRSKLYCFNCFGMLATYGVLAVINFVYRIARFDGNGVCIIGMQKKAMIPLVVFDVVVNVYLTALFIIPLRRMHAFKNSPSSPLRQMTVRTFIGSCTTLFSSVLNLLVVMILDGEPAWLCLMLCNLDILMCVLVLHWVTNRDSCSRSTSDTGGASTENE